MSILNSGAAFERIMTFLKKVFKGKPASIADLNKAARNLGLNENEVDNVIRAFKSQETTDLNKVDDLLSSTTARNQGSAETFELADASKNRPIKTIANDNLEQTFDGSIKKFADEIGGDVDEVKEAIASYVNDGYEAGSYKRVDPDSAESIASVIDVNTNYSKSSKINFIDDISEQINTDKAFSRVDAMPGDDLLREARTAQIEINPKATIQGTVIEPATDFIPSRVIKDPSDVKGLGNLKGPAGRNNTDAIVGMPDGIERSIKFVGERTGLPDSVVQKAIRIKMMEGYEAGNYKGLANEAEDMKAFVDNEIMGDDTLTFLEEIEEIGKELIDNRGVGSMTEAFDNAMDAKTTIDKADGGLIAPLRGPAHMGIGGMFKKK